MGMVNAAMMLVVGNKLFDTGGLVLNCFVKVEPSQCRDLASANQANPFRLPKQASAAFPGFRAEVARRDGTQTWLAPSVVLVKQN